MKHNGMSSKEALAEDRSQEENTISKNAFNYKEHYERDAIEFDYFEETLNNDAIHENRRLHEAIINELSLQCKNVLDVGCGGAWVAKYLLPRGFEVTSMDISSTNVDKALSEYPSDKHKGVVADAYSLPFDDGAFQNVIAAEIMEHVTSPERFVQSLLRVVKKGGKLIISTPYNEKIPKYLCVHCNCLTPRNAHLHSFDEEKVLMLVGDGVKLKTAKAFSNSWLAKLQTHIILRFLPFPMWRFVDQLANKLVRKPSRLLLIIEK